ncbi:MAG: phenylacetate--CoA ligase [Deltaproteobacteria bacterium]|nr:MAG: phenylacetate--CoA ligase [Deltaproteobacteria bacterium]
MSEFFNPDKETMSQDELRALQTQRMAALLERAYKNPAHKERFDRVGAKPGDFKSLEDLAAFPTMSKVDFRTNYPLGLNLAPRADIREMHQSSGTTGTPVVMPYTEADLAQWGECMARCYRMAGANPGDAVQITPSLGLFNGGFGFYHGARSMGMFIIPASAGNTPRQVALARTFGTRVLGAVVSYATRIMEVLEEEGGELPDLEIGIFGAEVFAPSMKEKIKKGLGIEVYDIYGMTETGGVGTLGMDCSAHDGIHLWEDHYYVEVLDRETGKQVPDGEEGELVVTALTREALPVIRFRTGDLTRVISRDKCSCGRTHIRLDTITGRVDDMLIIKGVNFFPGQVEQALMEIPGVCPHYQIIIEDDDGVKDVRINVEAEEGVTGFTVEKKLKEALGFSPKGDVFKPGELPRQEGKAQRVFFESKKK